MKYRGGGQWLRCLLTVACLFQLALRADQIIYDDALQNGWANWSWATVNLANTSPVHSGSYSISVTASNTPGNWQALYLDISAMSTTGFTNLIFWINGGASGGQLVQVQGILGSTPQPAVQIGPLPANTWEQITLSMSALSVANQANFTGFWLQAEGNSTVPTFYVDDISLVTNAVVYGTNAPVSIAVDAQANRHPISPQIYGTAFASSNQMADLNFTMNRSGGNAETRYNWQLNAHNHAADWYFESLDDGSSTPGASADDFVSNSKNGGAQAMITIPMIGWMPKLGASRGKLCSYSTNKYGVQTGNDWQWYTNAGNGISITNSTPITWNDPNDANFLTNVLFQQAYVQHLTNRWGVSTNGGVRYYLMDNEHSLWQSTHQDIHPVGPTMQEIWNDMVTYGSMVKSNDPNALVLGPEEWGWNGYFYSGYDQQWAGQHGWPSVSTYPDRTANGGWDYMPWLLNQFQQYDTANHKRLLDYFTLHCYPQEGNVGGNAVDSATELLRNQSTRQFWDTNYVDPSWINSVIALIPRMRSWVTTNYPGTKIGITEYNWGAEPYISGATAQADIYGIFGSQGLDLATRWTTPDSSTPTYNAMKMYRNYDGNKSTFGDTSVAATVPNPDNLSAFAAIRTNDSAMTLMVINKDILNATPLRAVITNFANSGTAQAWQLTSANVITRLADVPYANGILSNTLPSQSITLFILPTAKNLRMRIGTNAAPSQMELWMDGQGGQRYILQSSTNLTVWSAVSTNTFSSNSFRILINTASPSRMFYRGVLNSP